VTLEEAQKVANVLASVDMENKHMATELCEEIQLVFPEFKWKIIIQDFPQHSVNILVSKTGDK